MLAYKITDLASPLFGRLTMVYNGEAIILATPSEGQFFASVGYITNLLKEEVDLLNETWIHPHLYKPIKALVQGQKKEKEA